MPRLRLAVVLSGALFVCAAAHAGATPITLSFGGPVVGFDCLGPPCSSPSISTAVPIGTWVDLFLTLDPAAPEDPSIPCKYGQATATLVVLGLPYTGVGDVWIGADVFASGPCVPGSNLLQIVLPGWGTGGPALPGGWLPIDAGLRGLQSSSLNDLMNAGKIDKQFPPVYVFGDGRPMPVPTLQERQFYLALLAGVPEPGSIVLVATGLALGFFRVRRILTRPRPSGPPAGRS